jgi:hypothetical protein
VRALPTAAVRLRPSKGRPRTGPAIVQAQQNVHQQTRQPQYKGGIKRRVEDLKSAIRGLRPRAALHSADRSPDPAGRIRCIEIFEVRPLAAWRQHRFLR